MKSLYVCGTDTNVGKTYVSALLLKHFKNIGYWKPIGSGVPSDSQTIRSLFDHRVTKPVYEFSTPVSPHKAATIEQTRIDLDKIMDAWIQKKQSPLIIEGAGGLLVPLNETTLQIDLIEKFSLPVLLVALDTLGAINHTLLSLDACKSRNIAVEAVVLNRYSGKLGNKEAIEHFGHVRVLTIAENGIFDSADLDFLHRFGIGFTKII